MARKRTSSHLSLKPKERVTPEFSAAPAPSDGTSPLPRSPAGTSSLSSPPDDGVPRWYRPKEGSSYKKVAQILIYKASGMKTTLIAEKMDTTEGYIRHLMWLAGKNGWFTHDDLVDPTEELAFNTVHKVVRNINQALDGTELSDKQQEMTIETAKGLGVFKSHVATKVENTGQLPGLSIKIELPQNISLDRLELPEGSVAGGAPSYIEGEITSSGE